MAKARLVDVALSAGVSVATASRALGGLGDVAAQTRDKVLRAADEVGYTARRARSRRRLVAIVTPELDNPIFPAFAQAIEARLARQGMLSILCPAMASSEHEHLYIEFLRDVSVAGIVFITGAFSRSDVGLSVYQDLLAERIGIVLVNGVVEPGPVPAVMIDPHQAAGAAVRHLASIGHTRIGCLTGSHHFISSRSFYDGYVEAMRSLDLMVEGLQVRETQFTAEAAQATAAELLSEEVTGIVCGSDLQAVGTIAASRSLGREVPTDVSVVGFDGTPFATMTNPPLTTMRLPVDRMANAAANMMLQQIDGRERPQGQVFAAELIIGKSTAPPNPRR